MDTVLARAASSSLRKIIEGTLPLLTSPAQTSPLHRWLETYSSRPATNPSHERINRSIALQILTTETAERIPWVPSMNYQRHLARVSPTILRRNRPPYYSKELLSAYCAAQWPVVTENAEKQTGLFLRWALVMQSLSNCPEVQRRAPIGSLKGTARFCSQKLLS